MGTSLGVYTRSTRKKTHWGIQVLITFWQGESNCTVVMLHVYKTFLTIHTDSNGETCLTTHIDNDTKTFNQYQLK